MDSRHKKEQKELIGVMTGMKRQSNKKTRKSVLEECEKLQNQLDERQKMERLAAAVTDVIEEPQLIELIEGTQLAELIEGTQLIIEGPPVRVNRQKQKLAKRKQLLEDIKKEASLEAANQPDYRKIEIDSMSSILELQNLSLYEIKPDGHCLFASIQDQLIQRLQIDVSIQELRDAAAEYIKKNLDDFLPFLYDDTGLRDLDEYLKELTETAMWGGDMEILALGKVYDCSVKVFMAGASTLVVNEDGEKELVLGYYKHSYGLGEHYNSLRERSD